MKFNKLNCVQHFAEAKYPPNIDVIHKWLPIHYSFVLVQINLPSLIVMCYIEKNSCSKVRLGRLICTVTEPKQNSRHLWIEGLLVLHNYKSTSSHEGTCRCNVSRTRNIFMSVHLLRFCPCYTSLLPTTQVSCCSNMSLQHDPSGLPT